MRRWMMLAALLAGEVSQTIVPSLAQPFGFLFGDRQADQTHRPRRRHAPSAPVVIPTPVPRPHFADDPSPSLPDTTAAATMAQRPPEPAPLPAGPPEPPAKPAALGGVASDQKPPNPGEPTTPLANPTPPPQVEPPAVDKATSAVDTTAKAPRGPDTAASAKPLPVPVGAPPAPPLPPTKPTIAASGATNATSPRQVVGDEECPARLLARSVVAEPTSIGPQPDDRCTVVQPVRLSRLMLPGGEIVEFPDKPLIACATADAFSLYVRDLLSPLAKGTFGTGIGAVWTGPGLECRSRDHIFGAKLSAHGQGLAVDIAQVKLGDGRVLEIGEPKTPAETAFESASRAAGCGYFHTTLGPGSDNYHRTHWHFDLEVRGAQGDSKYCR